ncbi:GNAT family N-acetyltransferase [Peribacillus sp. SCS-37]|uniref:GNAT family N-acetyltransferase n=1 Tax=Paraperibacillus esterisolvens TaxID=3115296 RepID=UPI003905CB88
MQKPELLKRIKKLQEECEHSDGIELKLNWDMLKQMDEEELMGGTHFIESELAGFIAVYDFGSKAEICGMVDPRHRRKGIFTGLLQSVLEGIAERNYRKILLNAPGNSATAKEFIAQSPFSYSITEYQMKWGGKPAVPEHKTVHMRPAADSDRDLEIELDVQCFGFKREEAVRHHSRTRDESSSQSYIIENEGNPVGKARISWPGGKQVWIYGFAILPDFQGRGIGREVLRQIISRESGAGRDIFLEVEAENANALGLYTSCGFVSFSSQDYYRYDKS